MDALSDPRRLLVLNAGSSSIKFALFDTALCELLSGIAEGIGQASKLTIEDQVEDIPFIDQRAALTAVLKRLKDCGFELEKLVAVGHRVVHGGHKLTRPIRITKDVRREINDCTPLAPLHNPHNLAAIDMLSDLAPEVPQYASFDTSFHATNPEVATRYAIPKMRETKGIRRYGFHGLSYASMTQSLPHISGQKLPSRLLAFHLGNGASLCAILNGYSVATTMGYSPLDGLTMGTRSGGIDANAVLRLVSDNGLERTKAILNHESGLLGLSGGKSDMRNLMLDPSADSAFAIEHFCYWSLRHAGSLIAAMEGLDAIAFTGGIGENAIGVRARILRGLEWTGVRMDVDSNHGRKSRLHAASSKVAIYVVPAQEERMIATDALSILQGEE
jgi:acetate kinase